MVESHLFAFLRRSVLSILELLEVSLNQGQIGEGNSACQPKVALSMSSSTRPEVREATYALTAAVPKLLLLNWE